LELPLDHREGNKYRWYKITKDGQTLFLDDSKNLRFESLDFVDIGEYFAEIHNREEPILDARSRSFKLEVYPQSMSHESARDHTGKLRFMLHLPLDQITLESSAAVRQRLLDLGANPVEGESCLCGDEYSLWHMPEQLENGEEIIIGAVSQLTSACAEVEAVGGSSVQLGYDYLEEDEYGLNFLQTSASSFLYQWNPKGKDVVESKTPVKVAVVDVGIDKNHRDLAPFLQPMASNINCMPFDMGYNFVDNNANPFAVESSHGTHVAGILSGFIKDMPLQLLSLQVGRSGRDTRVFDLVCAIKYAMYQEVDLINVSMGYHGPESAILRQLVQDLSTTEIQLVAGAGNEGKNLGISPFWPAAYAEEFPAHVISVAAMDRDYSNLANFSNYDLNRTSIAAPGEAIRSTVNGRFEYGIMSGTSMATPFVSATLAYLKALRPGQSAAYYTEQLLTDTQYSYEHNAITGKVKNSRVLNVQMSELEALGLNRLRIQPNPMENASLIEWNNPDNLSFELSLYTLEGKLVRYLPEQEGEQVLLEKNELLPGIYVINLKKEDGSQVSRKLLVQ
ncbi:MAG: S8 family peptidase, partial [Bacteroidota bacterium]